MGTIRLDFFDTNKVHVLKLPWKGIKGNEKDERRRWEGKSCSKPFIIFTYITFILRYIDYYLSKR